MENNIGKELIQAIVKTSSQIKGVEKNSKVGSGSYMYKGVNDKDVKTVVGNAMQENGLAIVPTSIKSTLGERGKQSFVEVITSYLLMHESGQYMELQGYGHGVDMQDKAAGKATTYALKYALLYAFMISTGDIDDTDTTHSNDIKTPPAQPTKPQKKERTIVEAKAAIESCKTVEELKNIWSSLSKDHQANEVISKAKDDKKTELTPKK